MKNPKDPDDCEDEIYSFAAVFSELLFTLLPFAVLFLVYAYQARSYSAYLMAPEWAFASAVLFGQTIVKFVQGVTVDSDGNAVERIGLFVSGVIVLGLVPAMTVLALLLVATNPPEWLGYAQIGLAVVAAVTFIVFGAVGHRMAELGRKKR